MMPYCISFSSCFVCGPLVNKENLPNNHRPLKDALSWMPDKISKSGTPVMDFTQPRYNSISNMASVLRVNHTIRFYIILTVQNIPKFKDRANWSHDTFQPMRRHACVYQQTNQNIASVIKTFQNSGGSEKESVIVSRLSSIFLRLFMTHTQFF